MRRPLTVYMFGYEDWGNATKQLVEVVDAVEKRRGFQPPLFVDIRIRRNVRAVGFQGDTFEKRFGASRYRWMQCLGNRRVAQGRGGIEIQCPAAAEELLQLAIECAKRKRHVIYFCSCGLPDGCHREEVARLLLRAARKRDLALEVVEWPGGELTALDLRVPDAEVPKDRTSRLHLPRKANIADMAGLALGSLVTVHGPTKKRTVAVAPAMYAKKGWYLPVLQNSRGKVIPGTRKEAMAWRRDCGYLARRTGTP